MASGRLRRKGGIFNETVSSLRSLHSSQTRAPETVAPARAGSTSRRMYSSSGSRRAAERKAA